MVEVRFYDKVNDALLKFAVIIARSNGKWVFCKHKDRNTYEIPGGHREPGEDIMETARRELYEETGALEFTLKPAFVYSVTAPGSPRVFLPRGSARPRHGRARCGRGRPACCTP